MTYKMHRPILKRSDVDPWPTKLWDFIKSTFWLLYLIVIFSCMIFLAYQAIVVEMKATNKPGSKVSTPR